MAHAGADCVAIGKAVARGAVVPQDATTFVTFPQMDNYVCFSPQSWRNIQTYIGDLKLIAKRQCQ